MTRPILQIFFLLAPIFTATAAGPFVIDIVDLDGRKFSTADGQVTTLVIASSDESARAQTVGNSIPDYCLGNPKYRMITALEFVSHHTGPLRAIIRKLARYRVAAAARRLQARYDANQLKRDAREDVIVTTDFENAIATRFAIPVGRHTCAVVILNGKGELVQQWNDVPTREALDAAMRAAQ